MANNVTFTINLNGNIYTGLAEVDKAMRSVNTSVSSTLKFFDRLNQTAFKINNIVSVVQNVQSAIGGITEVGANAELQLMNMKTLFQGNSEAAADMYKRISQYGKVTPYDKAGLIDAQKTMMSFGIEGEKAFATLKQIGDIAMGDKQKMQSLSLAFAQMSSTGKLMGQDLLQMINAGFNPLNEISKMTGKSVAVLKEEMSKGAISADMVSQAFAAATAEGGLFYKAIDEASQTTAGKMAAIQDTIDEIKVSIFKATGDFGLWVNAASQIAVPLAQLAPLANVASTAFSFLKVRVLKTYTTLGLYNGYLSMGKVENLGFIKNVIQSAVALGRFSTVGLFNAIKGLGAYGLSLITGGALSRKFATIGGSSFMSLAKSAKIASKAINIAFMSNPLGWIAIAIMGVIAAVTLLWNKCEGFRRVVMGIWESIKAVFYNVWIVIKAVFDMIWNNILKPYFTMWKNIFVGIWEAVKWLYDGVVSIASAIGGFFVGIWDWVTKTVSNAFNWIVNKLGVVGTWIREKLVDPIKNAFTGIWTTIKDVFNKIISGLGKLFAPIKNLWNKIFPKDKFKDIGTEYIIGAEKGSDSYKKDHEEGNKEENNIGGPNSISVPKPISAQKPTAITPSGSLSSGSMGSSAGSSAGKAQQINITLKSMVETMNFNGGVKENARDVEAQLAAMMARILGMAETAI